jgi:GH25 family lysozyme M1 (1,4-beta-N-acetylmuramidase)
MTTIFGWDASHYDGEHGEIDLAVLTRARDEGIDFFTHKIGEGLTNVDTTAAAALIAARDAGIKVIGGYYFIHSGDMVAQAQRCIALADRYVPWWREFNGWFWQTDAETDTGGHLPSPSEVKLFSDTLVTRSLKRVIVYASHGMYGDRLRGLGHPLWNANYPSSRKADFRDLYPGNSYAGWTAYSGQTPVLCQYTSSATIAGRTTCDANAYRGTVDQLLALIGATAVTAPTPDDIANEIMHGTNPKDGSGWTGRKDADGKALTAGTVINMAEQAATETLAQSRANGASIAEIKAALAAGGGGAGGTVDVAALVEALRPVVAEELAKLKLTATP